MSKKRFRKIMGFIQDTTCEGGDVDGVMDLTEIENMLNKQQDIIQSLQKDIIEMTDSHQSYIEMDSETHSKMNDIIRTQRGKIFRLERDNEQLKNELRKEESLREYADSMYDKDLIVNIRFSMGEWKADVSVIDDE